MIALDDEDRRLPGAAVSACHRPACFWSSPRALWNLAKSLWRRPRGSCAKRSGWWLERVGATWASFFSSPGFVNEHLHVFLARGLSQQEADPDYDEDLTVVRDATI